MNYITKEHYDKITELEKQGIKFLWKDLGILTFRNTDSVLFEVELDQLLNSDIENVIKYNLTLSNERKIKYQNKFIRNLLKNYSINCTSESIVISRNKRTIVSNGYVLKCIINLKFTYLIKEYGSNKVYKLNAKEIKEYKDILDKIECIY